MSDRPTVLVLRALGLGDLLTGLPALAMLRRARPGDRIVLALPRELSGLALLSGSVDDVVHARELEPISDPPMRPELAIDLHGNGPESRDLLAAALPRRVIAFYGGGSRWLPGEHEVRRWCRLLAEGLPTSGDDLLEGYVPGVVGALPVPPAAAVPAGRTVVHCGAKSASRRWPADRFAEVAAWLDRHGHDVVVTGGAGEADLVAEISRDAGVEGRCDLALEELCALVAQARLVVCGDTGVAHLASNYAAPSVVLFGPVSPVGWGPPPYPRHQVLWYGDGTGDPHGSATDPALLRIRVANVLEAIPRALAAAADSGGLAPVSMAG